jgi:hypothetical protein
MRRIGAFVAVVFICLCTAVGFAQSANTSLRGVVQDPTGAVVSGATVSLHNAATGQTITTTSKGSGDYQLQQIPPAKYTITVTAPGFGSQEKFAELLVNQPATINFALTIKSSTEVVNVTEAAQTLNTTDASLGGTEDNATIQALPSEERNVADLLSLQPGVFFIPVTSTAASSQDSRSGAVNGGRSDQGNVTVDGIDDNDQVNGYAFFGVLRETQDSTEEFRVTTGDANSDAGRSSGAQISLVTKSGTNKFHGAAYEYFRPTDTVANDYFNKQAQLEGGEANRPPKLIRHVFGADVGGPIFKNKLFFFGNYEGRRQAESSVVVRTTPTANYQQGIITYQGDTSSGGLDPTPQTLSPAEFTALDTYSGCSVCNTTAYPNGPGANPNALAFLNSEPTANGSNTGDGGYNTGSYTFASPAPYTTNTTIVRIDYVPSTKHRIFGRGNLQKDIQSGVEQFPGQPPSSSLISNNKGIAFGDTWTITQNIVNDIRYGYTRQGSGDSGVGTGDYVDFRFIDEPTSETRSTILSSPVNNIVDNLNITKGNHSIQLGVNWRLIHQNRSSDANSYNNASTNPFWLKGDPPDPTAVFPNLEPVDGGFLQSYEEAFANLVGTVPSVTDVFNYVLTSPTSGTLVGDGTPLSRHFKANEYEGYIQDAWRAKPNLTMTFGLRYTVLQTPWETKGQEVTPTIDTDAWYKERESAALQGEVYEPDLSFAPAGPYYKKPGFYPKSKNNIAPRFALAYAPDNKTSIRAGFGIYYDHFGEGLVNIFDQNGEFGLSTSVTSPANNYTVATSPRFIDRHTLPFNNAAPASTATYPYTYVDGTEAITWGLDNRIKTPYSESFDLSVQRELPGGLTVEAAYVGRLGRHLLQSLDLAEPVDYTDPMGGGDYYAAAKTISQFADNHGGQCIYCGNSTTNPQIAPIPYFEDVFPYMATAEGIPGESATQAIYDLEWAPYRYSYGATTSLIDIDYSCANNGYCPAGTQSKFWQNQFASLYALASIGMSYYNAGQLTVRHPMSHGLQFDVSFSYSRSIDYGSDAERSIEFSTSGNASSNSDILNTWHPEYNKGVSDFDTKILTTVNWVYQLPFGKGKPMLANKGPIVDAIVGGWQSSGIFRDTSGLPFSFFEPGWTTDWQIESYGVVTDKSQVKPQKHISPTGQVTYFTNAGAISGGIYNGSPVRIPYAGEAGERNNFRGDGYISLDTGLAKSWQFGRFGALKFAWEVYNATNTPRFDPLGIGAGLSSGSLGTASSEFTSSGSRRMQFSLRYDF